MDLNGLRSLCGVVFFTWIPIAGAQAPAPGPAQPETQLSPQAAYDQAVRPLDITRRAPQNWSDIELAALKVARENAKAACDARDPDQASGEDLVALARLCAFAMEWQPVHKAASNYIAASQAAPHVDNPRAPVDLATAFDYKVQASLNLKEVDDAIATTQTMLRTVPYNGFASEATTATIDAIRFTRTDQALALLKQRQPMILALINALAHNTANSERAINQPGVDQPLPLHVLYADAIALPSLEQYANDPATASSTYAELEATVPQNISADERLSIVQRRRQYLLLGTHLPALNPTGYLLPPMAAPPNLNTWFSNGSVFLLFPDWCNQCVALAYNCAERSKDLVANFGIRFFSLLAQANPPEKAAEPSLKNIPLPAKAAKAAQAQSQPLHFDQQITVKSTPDKVLFGTPTVVVSNQALNDFAATDFPLLIVTDHDGVVRWIQRASDDTFAADGDIDKIVQHVVTTWRSW